jgi:very-short-patch-repair endonuclease
LPVLDAALFARACTRVELSHAVDAIDRLAGARQARDLVPLADGRAECRQESQLRLILFDGGLTGFVPQLLVTDGRIRHHLDLGDPDLKVGAEYDGRSHADPARLGPDRERHNFLSDLGWRMRYFTGFVIYRRPRQVVATVCRAARSPA